jgi:hypothetical protein
MIALEPRGKGLMGTLLRYPYEVRNEGEYFDEIPNIKIEKEMLDLAKHIVKSIRRASEADPHAVCAMGCCRSDWRVCARNSSNTRPDRTFAKR